MATVCQFVDSVDAAPAVRLDLNDAASGVVLQREGTDFPLPSLAQSVASNFMRDGGLPGASVYGMRWVRLRVHVSGLDADDAASALQAIYRECDRADNFLKWQPDGLTKPVFFHTYRSAPENLDVKFSTALGLWVVQLALLAEPFAIGLRETLGPYTVNNDPAHASNGCYVDVTGVIGDVAAPCVIVNTTRTVGLGVLAVRQHGTPTDFVFFKQAEAMLLGLETANPGGGPDAAMSGTGTNNYVRTTFTDAVMKFRLAYSDTGLTAAQLRAARGTHRVIAVVRRTDSTSVIEIGFTPDSNSVDPPTSTTTVPLSTSRQVVDLGLVSIGSVGVRPGYSSAETGLENFSINLWAQRVSGTGNLDWDCVFLVPADESALVWTHDSVGTTYDLVVDGVQGSIWRTFAGSPFDGTAAPREHDTISIAGGFPNLVPNQTNRVVFIEAGASNVMTKGNSSSVSFDYWPRYLHIRPSAT